MHLWKWSQQARSAYGGLVVCVAVTGLLAGCGSSPSNSSDTPGAADDEASASASTIPDSDTHDQASESAETSGSSQAGSPSTAPSGVPSAPSVSDAVDGTDLEACEDGECEVFVTAGESIPLPAAPVLLESLASDEFTFAFEPADAGGSVACNERCSMSGGFGGPTTVTMAEGSIDAYDSRLTVVVYDAEALILSVAPLS